MSRDPDCVFCKIVAGEIPSTRVLETDRAIAFMDVNPIVPGHVLLVPRDHHVQLADLPDELAAHLGSLLPRLIRGVVAATEALGSNVVVNGGRVAGQVVDHCHWHVIPRRSDDVIRWPWPQGVYSGDAMAQWAAEIIAAMA